MLSNPKSSLLQLEHNIDSKSIVLDHSWYLALKVELHDKFIGGLIERQWICLTLRLLRRHFTHRSHIQCLTWKWQSLCSYLVFNMNVTCFSILSCVWHESDMLFTHIVHETEKLWKEYLFSWLLFCGLLNKNLDYVINLVTQVRVSLNLNIYQNRTQWMTSMYRFC